MASGNWSIGGGVIKGAGFDVTEVSEGINGCAKDGDVILTISGVTDLTPFGITGRTGIAPGNEAESFLFSGGNNSGGKQLGIVYFSKALYTKCMACN